MQAQLGIAYAAWVTTDDRGGRGKCLGYFSVKPAAVKAALGKGWYGGDGEVQKVDTITVGANTWILSSVNPITVSTEYERTEETRKAILDRLTPEERKALGF